MAEQRSRATLTLGCPGRPRDAYVDPGTNSRLEWGGRSAAARCATLPVVSSSSNPKRGVTSLGGLAELLGGGKLRE
jgi:hypothetical protein